MGLLRDIMSLHQPSRSRCPFPENSVLVLDCAVPSADTSEDDTRRTSELSP